MLVFMRSVGVRSLLCTEWRNPQPVEGDEEQEDTCVSKICQNSYLLIHTLCNVFVEFVIIFGTVV
jgi:hypothetical protein